MNKSDNFINEFWILIGGAFLGFGIGSILAVIECVDKYNDSILIDLSFCVAVWTFGIILFYISLILLSINNYRLLIDFLLTVIYNIIFSGAIVIKGEIWIGAIIIFRKIILGSFDHFIIIPLMVIISPFLILLGYVIIEKNFGKFLEEKTNENF